MQNRFNRLGSKEWLPFQKSWFRYQDLPTLYRSNLRFFCKADAGGSQVVYMGPHRNIFEQVAVEENIPLCRDMGNDAPVQFIFIDLLDEITPSTSLPQYEALWQKTIHQLHDLYPLLEHRRFVAIMARNVQVGAAYFPFAWHLAKMVGEMFSLKDEKIACLQETNTQPHPDVFTPQKDIFYGLYFRKDEHSTGQLPTGSYPFFGNNLQAPQPSTADQQPIPKWFVLKPQPRKKNEVLHPAKYPEDLVEMFIGRFTRPGQTVFDPMSGTGSTQLGALRLGRYGFGTELSEFFAGIAIERLNAYCQLANANCPLFRIAQKDARLITADDTPPIDYLLTSPPYWDMLNMKGAENQAKRIEKGLQTNYSDTAEDLGNLADYHAFVDELVSIYLNLADLMNPGSYATIVVKNIKKKGRNYPFAWDLALALQQRLILLPEVFWCQDDLSIAPYGYGNTWVSNTFHQYCLNFQKPY